jgi:hypothetical protein
VDSTLLAIYITTCTLAVAWVYCYKVHRITITIETNV